MKKTGNLSVILLFIVSTLLIGLFGGCAKQQEAKGEQGNKEEIPALDTVIIDTPIDMPSADSQPSDSAFPKAVLTDENRDAIIAAMEKKHELNGHTVKYKYGDGYIKGLAYYGEYGDCLVFLDPGQLCEIGVIDIGEYRFTYSSSFALYALYEKETLMTLKEAYEAGLISNEEIEYLSIYHKIYEGGA